MWTWRVVCVFAALASADAFGKKKTKDGADLLREELDRETEAQQQAAEVHAAGGTREYELDNMARHRSGELNTAELGFENMKNAMKDPSAMAEVAEMMKDPESVQSVQKMMADPAFQAQAKAMMANMPDMSKMMQDPAVQAKMQQMMQDPAMMAKAKQMASAMYGGGAGGAMGGMGGAGAGGGAAAELARLRAENAALRGAAGI
jgi:hypothetical protein